MNRAGGPPQPVRLPVTIQRWRWLTFLHWRYPPDEIRRLVPAPLEVDTLDGAAWIGLTPFVAELRPPLAPRAACLRFPETNVRTYVRTPGGQPGVWFFSLDAASFAAVAGARAAYRLPYMWSRMRVEIEGPVVRYRSRRRWPQEGVRSAIEIEVGAALEPAALEHFLTARFRLYTLLAGSRIAYAQVEHPAWPLRHAQVLRLEQNLLGAAGLAPPGGDPLVCYSPGVEVRVGRLKEFTSIRASV